MAEEEKKCKHDWRVVETLFKEVSREERVYPCYCTKCLAIGEIVLLLRSQNE